MANAWDNLKQLLASETATVGEVKAFLSTLPERALGEAPRGASSIDTILFFLFNCTISDEHYQRARWGSTGNWQSSINRTLSTQRNSTLGAGEFVKRVQTDFTGSMADELRTREALAHIVQFVEEMQYPLWQQFSGYINGALLQQGGAGEEEPAAMRAEDLVEQAIQRSRKGMVVFTGAPGTGKTYCVEEYVKTQTGQSLPGELWEFVQFHSSFDYTDFVEGLRPILSGETMLFVRVDGIFKSFCRRAAADSDRTYYFIIDEINRADLGRVFGELMYCFEKRGPEHQVKTQYHNLPTAGLEGEDLFADGFYLPPNLVVLGTMNDIDRSVETFDFALRRRFDWVEIDANTVMHSSLKSMAEKGNLTGEVTEELVGQIKKMNEIIARQPGLGREFAIGPSYFKGYDGNNLEEIWNRNIRPILREYMRGRRDGDAFVSSCRAALLSTHG